MPYDDLYAINHPPLNPYDPFYGAGPGQTFIPGQFPGGGGAPGPQGLYGGAPGPTNPADPMALQYGGYFQYNPLYGTYSFVPMSPQQYFNNQTFGTAPGNGVAGGGGPGPVFSRSPDGRSMEARDPLTGAPLANAGSPFVYKGTGYVFNPQTQSYQPVMSTGQPNGPAQIPGGGGGGAPYSPSGAPSTATPQVGKSGFDWANVIAPGLAFVNDYLAGRQASKNADAARKAGEQTRAAALGAASPENYLGNMNKFSGAFYDQYRPALRTIAESLALGEQANLQEFDTDLARSGISSGSGIHLAGRNAIRSQRQASYGEAMRDFYSKAAEDAKDAAGRTQSLQVSANLGAPVPYVPSGPSTVQSLFGAGTQAYGAYNYYKALRERGTVPPVY